MTRGDIKDLLVETIESKQGIKATQLVAVKEVVDALMEHYEDHIITTCLEELVLEGRLVEIEYVLPEMDYRVKSFYLPAGTKVNVRCGKSETLQ